MLTVRNKWIERQARHDPYFRVTHYLAKQPAYFWDLEIISDDTGLTRAMVEKVIIWMVCNGYAESSLQASGAVRITPKCARLYAEFCKEYGV